MKIHLHYTGIDRNTSEKQEKRTPSNVVIRIMTTAEKLYLLACVAASNKNVAVLSQLFSKSQTSSDFINAIIVFWPELSDPLELKFLFEEPEAFDDSEEDLLVQLIATDPSLISSLEIDNDSILKRFTTVKAYVDNTLSNLLLDNFEMHWLKKRMIYCNRMVMGDAFFYKPLWLTIKGQDKNLDKWIYGIVEPLTYINQRRRSSLSIQEFESMDVQSILNLMMAEEVSYKSQLESEVIPYLFYQDNNEITKSFISDFIVGSRFPLITIDNYETLKYSFNSLLKLPLNIENKQLVEKLTLQIIFENSPTWTNIIPSGSIRDLLSIIPNDVDIDGTAITAGVLLTYSKYIDSYFRTFNFKDLYAISLEDEAAQSFHFSSISREVLTDNTHSSSEILHSILHIDNQNAKVFTKLNETLKTKLLFETILSIGNFELLNELLKISTKDLDFESTQLELLEKYFWQFYNSASNGATNNPEMIKTQKILDILQSNNNEKYGHLSALMDALEKLSHYAMNAGKGILFKPSNLLEHKEDPTSIISTLLELNPTLYKNISATFEILKKIVIGLNLIPSNTEYDEEYTKVLVLHIDHSLVNMDFTFAYEHTLELLERDNVSQYWSTIIQVAKFSDPSWLDNEIPTEVIFLQLEIVGKLLNICPTEEIELATSHWSTLEIELATRDVIHDKYSLENKSDSYRNISLEHLSNKVSNLLNGFK